MNKIKIKKALDRLKDEADHIMWVDECVIDLLHLLAEESLNCATPEETTVDTSYITLQAFEKNHPFISTSTLTRYCHQGTGFGCAWYKGRWHIDEKEALQFLKNLPYYQKRLKRGFYSENTIADSCESVIEKIKQTINKG